MIDAGTSVDAAERPLDIARNELRQEQPAATAAANSGPEPSNSNAELRTANAELSAANNSLVRSQLNLTGANRALTLLGDCKHALLHATSKQELLDRVCALLIGPGGYELAWVGFPGAKQAQSLVVAAVQSRAAGYARQWEASMKDGASAHSPAETALRTRQLCFGSEQETPAASGGWNAVASVAGLHAACAIPFGLDDVSVGVLEVYAHTPAAFTAEETGVLTQLADLLAVGIALLLERDQRLKVEAALDASRQALEATNEELNATNEELNATNEELLALNEEAAAINEELNVTLDNLNESQTQLGNAKDYAERLIETANALVVSLDCLGQVEILNQAAADLLGYSKQELLGEDWFETATPADCRAELVAMYDAIRKGTQTLPPQYSNAVLTKSGERREIEWRNCTFERDGKFDGCLAIGVDVTDRILAEQALRASEMRYRRLFETAKDGILILDANSGTVVDVNPYLSELLGLSYDQLLGRKVWELGFLKDVAASRENFLELQQHEYIRYENLPLETAEGVRIDAEFVSNVYQVNGRRVIQCNIRNITQRKKAELALQVLHAELEQRVFSRTAELASTNEALQRETVQRLRAEELQLTAVLEERTRIAREIHDTLAQGFAGIIIQLEAAEDVLAENQQTALNHLVKARQLARDSLTDARRSMWALRPQMLDKGDLVYAISAMLEGLARESTISMEFAYHGERTKLPREIEDGLLRICQEAVMNAGKHSQARNIHIVLGYLLDAVELRIEDNGHGFDATSTPFLRGFGIRIMKERAVALNGSVSINSVPGKGAVVLARVPVNGNGNGGQHD